jgi:site-specific recombinase XerD
VDALRARGYAASTIKAAVECLHIYERFLEAQALDPMRVTPGQLAEFHTEVGNSITPAGLPLRPGTINNILGAVKRLYRQLFEADVLAYDPARKLQLVKQPPRLPPPVISEAETARLLDGIDPSDGREARDRALLELMYSTGARVNETASIEVDDLDLANRTVRINKGKGGKQRVVPFGPVAAEQLDHYIRWVRPDLAGSRATRALWLTSRGTPMRPYLIRRRMERYVRQAELGRKVTPHGLRHACATHLLERHADLRHIQELLGHSSVETTQIYTRVSVKHLKKTLERCHPRERAGSDEGDEPKPEV